MSYRQIAISLLCMCGVILVWRTFVAITFSNGLEWARDTTDCRADSILFGCALACLEKTSLAASVFTRRRLERLILPICFALLLITLLIRNPVFRETIRYSIQGVALAPILYYFVQTPAGWAGRILNTQVLTFLGTVSYALYLLHATVLLEINQIIPSKVLAGVLSLFVAILLAYLVHIFVEKPTDAMRKKFRHTSDKMQQTQVEKSSAAVVVP
jgi:peptidoglycan/LPS O-acetylase OafA/YrhL